MKAIIKISIFFSVAVLSGIPIAKSQTIPENMKYMGQFRPGLTPEIFSPNIVSQFGHLQNITFTPDEREIYFTVYTPNFEYATIMVTKFENNKWKTPVTASFNIKGNQNYSPFISPNGEKLYFVTKPPNGLYKIWSVERIGQEWSEPVIMPAPINNPDYESATPFVANDGTLYFLFLTRSGGRERIDIYCSPLIDGKYLTAKNVGEPINSKYIDEGQSISPDGRFMIFASDRPGTKGDTDLWISIKNKDGTWQPPKNAGSPINTPAAQRSSRFSLDGKYFFYFSENNMYWVDSKVFDKFIASSVNLQWNRLPINNPPPVRYLHAQIYDPKQNKLTIFGGDCYYRGTDTYTQYNDTWQANLSTETWKKIETDIKPSPRGTFGILDYKNNRFLIYGGFTTADNKKFQMYNDLWQFNLDSLKWAKLFTENPPDNIGNSLVYDPVYNQILLFGGEELDFPHNHIDETWALELDSLKWKKLNITGQRPHARFGNGAVYDSVNQRMIIYGGKYRKKGDPDTQHQKYLNDTWELNLKTLEWKEIEYNSPSLKARAGMAMFFDNKNNRLIIYGGVSTNFESLGDSWQFDLTMRTW